MKNQYFGDINDYYKYGLIRLLSNNQSIPTSICWMLTPDIINEEGNQTQYFAHPNEWKEYDTDLFDFLYNKREIEKAKDVRAIYGLLDKVSHIDDILTDDKKERAAYFEKLKSIYPKNGLMFYDPDIGMEIETVHYGANRSSQYLYWREAQNIYHQGVSLLVYQHYRRIERSRFIRQMAEEFLKKLESKKAISFATDHVVFYLVPALTDPDKFDDQIRQVEKNWRGKIVVYVHGLTEEPIKD